MSECEVTAPVLRLPPELMTKVFRETVLEYWNSAKDANRAPPWVPSVTHVCRYWRSVALDDPQLWSRIGSFPSYWAAVQLERSKNTALHCRVPLAVEAEENDTLILKALEQAHRFCYFSFMTDMPYHSATYGHSSMLKSIFATHFPMLHSLNMVTFCMDPRVPDMPPESMKMNLPQPKHLHLSDFRFRWTSPLFSDLETLHLETETEDQLMGTLAKFLDALERMPLLEKLDLRWMFGGVQVPESVHPSRVITMAHIQSLVLNVTHVSDCIDILSHISYPPSTKIKLEFECLGPESDDEWYNEDQIRRLIVPRLGSCLQTSFLSNAFAVSSDAPIRATPECAVLAIEIGTSHQYHVKYLSTWTQLVYRAWLDDIDFGTYPHPSSSYASSSKNQIPDPAIFISAATENMMPTMDKVRKHFLPLLPLPKLRSIALDEKFDLDFFKELGKLPNLEVISMNGRSAIAFVMYTSGAYAAIKSGNAGLQEAFVGAAFNAGHDSNRTSFPSLKSLIFENADFGSQYRELTWETIQRSDLLDFLRCRRDYFGLAIHLVRLVNCVNLSTDFVEEIKRLVQNIEWDGKIEKRTKLEFYSDDRGIGEVD